MRLDTGQHMRMDQRMKLSPRMIQSMEILQLAATQLEERIEQELQSNPVLEVQEIELRGNDQAVDAIREGHAEEADVMRDGARPLEVGDGSADGGSEDFRRLDDMSRQYGEDWADNAYGSSRFRGSSSIGDRDGKMDAMANTADRAGSLTEQLLDQWRYVETDAETHAAGVLLIEAIEPDGYLRTSLANIAIDSGMEWATEAFLESVLNLVQMRLEPAGLGARDLSECLLLQIDTIEAELEPDEGWDIARTLVSGYLQDIGMNRLPQVSRKTGYSLDQIKRGMRKIKTLDPKPGRQISPELAQVIIPDVHVEFDPIHDVYVAGLNQGRQPALRINTDYQKLAKDKTADKSAREFINKNMGNATWLIDSINQRNNTLLRVVNAVLVVQRDFLDHGPQHLKPLPMTQVADQLGIHVGTVSRAVSEKYIQTPRGIYPLRMFFSGGTESDEGGEMSWAAIQAKLKEIVENEDPKKPLSDDALVTALKDNGIQIARRTVAKYRQQLGIPTARQRKQY